ncbi:ATP-binding protein [Streptomyces sp. NPDC004542]|uniref:ATP-binding protein n=1 Tax=Streptomyces sp. NPDC004542 TaxID=3154281 RepID=UPI0033A86B08
MVIPLRNQTADGQTSLAPAPLRYSATWEAGTLRGIDARRAVSAFLGRLGYLPDQRVSQDAQLVVSELVTNALQHAPGPCGLLLELSPGADVLRITVWDTCTALPELQPRDGGRIGGHGLRLVAMLCADLRTGPLDGGKRVTADLRLPPPSG